MQSIAIIDDHQLFSSGLVLLLAELPFKVETTCFTSAQQCLDAPQISPALIMLDFYVPGSEFTETFIHLSSQFECPIVVVSASPSPADRQEAERAGALGFVNKHAAPEELLEVVKSALQGKRTATTEDQELGALADFGLTNRQLEILLLVSKGCSNKEIANLIDVSPETVKSHLKTVFRHIDVQSRIEAVEFVRERGVI